MFSAELRDTLDQQMGGWMMVGQGCMGHRGICFGEAFLQEREMI